MSKKSKSSKKPFLWIGVVGVFILAMLILVQNFKVSNPQTQIKESSEPKTYADLAVKIRNEYPSYDCPNVTALYGWINDYLKANGYDVNHAFDENDNDKMIAENKLFWACWVTRAEEYKAEAKEASYNQQNQAQQAPRVINIPQVQPIQVPRIRNTYCNTDYFTGQVTCTTY